MLLLVGGLFHGALAWYRMGMAANFSSVEYRSSLPGRCLLSPRTAEDLGIVLTSSDHLRTVAGEPTFGLWHCPTLRQAHDLEQRSKRLRPMHVALKKYVAQAGSLGFSVCFRWFALN